MFANLFANRRPKSARHARRSLSERRLRCEPLEDRQLLSVTFSNNTAQNIVDKGTITSAIAVPDSFIVADLNVKVNIQHTRDTDLGVFLIAPDNTRVELFTNVGTKTSQNFTNTILDDAATTSITLGTAPFTGTFRPEGNLSAVEGKQVQGTWKLEITDGVKQATGKLLGWSIDVTNGGVPADGPFIDTNSTMLGNAGRPAVLGTICASRKVVVSNDGSAMAVWLESKGVGDTGPWNAMAAEYLNGSWQTPVVILDGNSSNVENGLELVGDGFGNYLVVEATIPGATQIRARRYVAGAGWQAVESVGGGTAFAPRASMARGADGATRAVVAWGDDTSRDAKINRLDNFATGLWSGVEIAESLPAIPGVSWNTFDVAMAQNGDFMLVFSQSQTSIQDPSDAYYRVYRQDLGQGVGGWEATENLLEGRSEPAQFPRVEMNSSGKAMVVWRQLTGSGGTVLEIWGRRWDGVAFGAPQLIADAGTGSSNTSVPTVAMSENGEAIVFWAQKRDGSAFTDAYVRRHDGTQWGPITKLDTEDLGNVNVGGSYPENGNSMNIAMDDAGNATAVWAQSDGTYVNMWASQFNRATSTWSTDAKLENAALDAVLPSVDMNAGVAQVIWTQSNGVLNHMYAATLTVPAPSQPAAAAPGISLTLADAALLSLTASPTKTTRALAAHSTVAPIAAPSARAAQPATPAPSLATQAPATSPRRKATNLRAVDHALATLANDDLRAELALSGPIATRT